MATDHLPNETPDSELLIKTLSKEYIYAVGSTGNDQIAVRFGEPTLGDNLLENPLFANPGQWSTGAGWRIEHGVATHQGTQQGHLYQKVKAGLKPGLIYRVRGVTAAWDAGQYYVYFASGSGMTLGPSIVNREGIGQWEGAGSCPQGAVGIDIYATKGEALESHFSFDSVILQEVGFAEGKPVELADVR
jgi:hypothetical protein